MKIRGDDRDGHQYILTTSAGDFYLHRRKKPVNGEQDRWLGRITRAERLWQHWTKEWHRADKCWYVPRFPLYRGKTFGFVMIELFCAGADGCWRIGWVHVGTVKSRYQLKKENGYEARLAIKIEDLKPTRKEALVAWLKKGNDSRRSRRDAERA